MKIQSHEKKNLKAEIIEEDVKREASLAGNVSKRRMTAKVPNSSTHMNDVFLSNNAQKKKDEVRKMTLEKRKQYGKMIQKQVLKMHKKKTITDEKPTIPENQSSQGSKNFSSKKRTPDVIMTVITSFLFIGQSNSTCSTPKVSR